MINAKQKIKLLSEKLLDEHSLGSSNDTNLIIKLEKFLPDTGIDKDDLFKFLDNLQEKGLVKKVSYWNINKSGDTWKRSGPRAASCNLVSINVVFNFRELITKYITEQLFNSEEEIKSGSGFLYLDTTTGNFWHGDKTRFCYPMGATKDRLIILKYLVENKGLQATERLASVLGKEKQNIRIEMAKIKMNIKKYLKLEDVIQSKKDSGYEINQKYEVILV